MNAVTEHGFTADEVAANSGHDNLATLVHHLRQVCVQHLNVGMELCPNKAIVLPVTILV